MKTKELMRMGIPKGDAMKKAKATLASLSARGENVATMRKTLEVVIAKPESYLDDLAVGKLAALLVKEKTRYPRSLRSGGAAPWRQWGRDLDEGSVKQMRTACELPVAVAGALMPDAHLGYGLPIGGVLATKNAVIPYAVGVDIACRVKLTVTDVPVSHFESQPDRLRSVLEGETRFGVGAKFKRGERQHDVMDRDWSVSPVTQREKDKAWGQLGTSGSGNHFVEFGVFNVNDDTLGVPAGEYVALLSHSGSRGTGYAVCDYYSKIARARQRHLPKEMGHLAWLDLDSEAGNEYWLAMNLMGEYASANHDCIHRHVIQALGAESLLDIENHHNFAWKETHNGEEVIVHRKGATPAEKGVLGVIPGTMATLAHIVRGRGNPESLMSASHGAGRVMSRKQAHRKMNWRDSREVLKAAGVTLLSAGLDEVPMVYKDIHTVMAAQLDLVETVATFMPKIVKMSPAGERPED